MAHAEESVEAYQSIAAEGGDECDDESNTSAKLITTESYPSAVLQCNPTASRKT